MTRNDRTRALRAIRALRPGETCAAVLLDPRKDSSDDASGALRMVTERTMGGTYRVQLEEWRPGEWRPSGEDLGVATWETPVQVRTCLDFYAQEADARAADLAVDAGLAWLVYATPPLYFGGPLDEHGVPSVCYRVRREPRENGRYRVWIEEAFYQDPERWFPSSLGYGRTPEEESTLYDTIAADEHEAAQIAHHYSRLVLANQKHIEAGRREEWEGAPMMLGDASLDQQWTANAARVRTARERGEGAAQ